MNRLVCVIVCAFVAMASLCAQDVIITNDAQKIDAKIIEVSKTEIKYKEKDNLDGPTFVMETTEISSIIYATGKVVLYNQQSLPESKNEVLPQASESSDTTIYFASEFHGDYLPQFAYKKVSVPGKKHMKRRYVGGNMVLTEKEFIEFIKLHCPEAYHYHKLANMFLAFEIVSILLGVIPVIIFGFFAVHKADQVLPTYNASCGVKQVSMLVNPQDYFKDKIQLSKIHNKSKQMQ